MIHLPDRPLFLAVAVALLVGHPVPADEAIDRLIEPILQAPEEGIGNRNAAQAWRELTARGGEALLPALAALDASKPAANNWLLTAVDAIVEGERSAGRSLPETALRDFVRDRQREPIARRIAFEILTAEKPETRDPLLTEMIDDPSNELRRDALAVAIEKAEALKAESPEKAKQALAGLFPATRDQEQAEKVAGLLADLGETVDLTEHFNFVTEWRLIGPFDSTGGVGFGKTFPPESEIELDENYLGKDDKNLEWKSATTTEKYATVDLNAELGKFQGACAYAFVAIDSPEAREMQVRVTTKNALKIFLNGEEIFSLEEYHHGSRFDQYVADGKFREGRNELLLKLCQNEQKEPWAQTWQFQCRVSDRTGGKIPMTLADPGR